MEHVPWWQSAVVYQIYPRSFSDSNSDGVGDLQGIRSRLDYLQWLGIDVLWLSPVFRSPMADFGYDVSDYCDIDPIFGTLADMDELIADCHRRDMRLMLDWVPNHTSDQHPWFQQSRRDRTNPKADWYVWRDEPANNWLGSFREGTSAWQFDEQRGQWYLHCFLREQPDLNWDVQEVETAMQDTLRFWLDRGVDGFRMDVVHLIGKNIDVDDPPALVERGISHVPFNDVPVTHERLRSIRRLLDSYDGERTSVGEVYLLDEAAMAAYYGNGDELHLSFNFSFLWAKWDATRLRDKITSTLSHLDQRGAWPTWVLSNHDVPRHRQRYGGTEEVARMAAVMLLTLPGTPFMYQGEELAMVDAAVDPNTQLDPGGRDGCRAPLPWEPRAPHGWPHTPWLGFAPNPDQHNVATLQANGDSILHLYRNVLALRHAHPSLHRGSMRMIERDDHVLAYERTDGHQRVVIALNLSDEPSEVVQLASARLLITSQGAVADNDTLARQGMLGAQTAVIALLT